MPGGSLIELADISRLPKPVQRCLIQSGVIGTPRIKSVRLEQTGRFKTAPNRPWAPFTAVQTFDLESPGFEWQVRMKMAPFIIVKGRDQLLDGRGSMLIKLFGLFPIVNERGPEMDQGAMTRYLSEAVWFPQVFIKEFITWESLDSLSARATLTIGEKSATGIFSFDALGRITEFSCQRYAMEGKTMVLRRWRTPTDAYGEREGLRIGVKGRAIWERPEGDYTYVDLEITTLKYE